MSKQITVLVAVLVMVFGLLMVAEPGAAADAADTQIVAQEETTPPETSPPAETTPPDTGGDEAPWWVLLIVLGALFVLIVALLAGRRRKAPPPAATPEWKTHARSGYAEARWLADQGTEPLAIWHGDSAFEERDGTMATDAANAKTWDQLGDRKQRATSELYALEAASGPGSPALKAAQRTTAAVNETYAALTERSDARLAYRKTAKTTDAPGQAADLTAARDREVRASAKLAEARQELAAALKQLTPIA